MRFFKCGVWVFVCAMLSAGIWACASDNNKAGNTTGDRANLIPEAEKEKMKQGLERARKVEETYDRFSKNVLALREEVAKVPGAHKQKALDFAEMESQLQNYPEKGAVMVEEVRTLIRALEGGVNPAAATDSDTPEIIANPALAQGWEQTLKDIELSINDYNVAYARLEKAVEKLKNSNGAAVKLFE